MICSHTKCDYRYYEEEQNILIEKLAAYAHDAWTGWMKYLFSKSIINDDGTATIPKWAVDRWTRQCDTTYEDLPEEEKTSDRNEADKIISIMVRESY